MDSDYRLKLLTTLYEQFCIINNYPVDLSADELLNYSVDNKWIISNNSPQSIWLESFIALWDNVIENM